MPPRQRDKGRKQCYRNTWTPVAWQKLGPQWSVQNLEPREGAATVTSRKGEKHLASLFLVTFNLPTVPSTC